ncbi:hypothetical protein CRENBAI_020067 [Crenichthys baileyi]|uniref:Uncharacterized protein n=1 Tax=Crenichthys baileyi TaxID=28760 RepID=A0AAV9RQS2_9TELE
MNGITMNHVFLLGSGGRVPRRAERWRGTEVGRMERFCADAAWPGQTGDYLPGGERVLTCRSAGVEREPVIGRRKVLPPLRERVWMSRKHGWSDPDTREWLDISSPERAEALEGRRDAQAVWKPRAATTQADVELYHVIT